MEGNVRYLQRRRRVERYRWGALNRPGAEYRFEQISL